MNNKLHAQMSTETTNVKHATTPNEYAFHESNAIVSFTYYANNFHYDFIQRVWGVDTMISNHLQSKWDVLVGYLTVARKETDNRFIKNLTGTELFYKFYMMLDSSNKELLNEFILNNHKF